jgi:hypothetical protein
MRGSEWVGDQCVPAASIYGSPSAVLYSIPGSDPKIYLVHQGKGKAYGSGDGLLWYNVLTGADWSGAKPVPGSGITDSPSAVVFRNKLYVFHQAHSELGTLWYNVFGGDTWSGDTKVPNTGMSASPSATIFNDKIYVFHQGGGLNGQLWYNVFDGSGWAGDAQVPGAFVATSPAAVAFNGRLYVFTQASSSISYRSSPDGVSWTGDQVIPGTGIASGGSPGVTVFRNGLVVAHEAPSGQGKDGQLWYQFSSDGTNWIGDSWVPDTGIAANPSVLPTAQG